MSKIETGGTAFPTRLTGPCRAHGIEAKNGELIEFTGMTLRDYFAAKAMQAMLSTVTEANSKDIAHIAYKMADSMLDARK